VLFFELFPAFLMIVSAIVGIWLYASNRSAPDESADDARRQHERKERAAAADAAGDASRNPDIRRPSMLP
jgi:hypothetical protein